MGRGCSELELGVGLHRQTCPGSTCGPSTSLHLPLQIQTTLSKLIPFISLLTQEVVPTGLMGGVGWGGARNSEIQEETRGRRLGSLGGKEEGAKKPSRSKRGLAAQGTRER